MCPYLAMAVKLQTAWQTFPIFAKLAAQSDFYELIELLHQASRERASHGNQT